MTFHRPRISGPDVPPAWTRRRPTPTPATHPLQTVQELKLLQHAWRGHPQGPHQHVMPESGAVTQPERNKDKHDGRLDSGPPQKNSSFGFRMHPTCPTSATCPRPCNVAAAPASCEFYSNDGNNASDYADDALPDTLTGNTLHGATVWTSPPTGAPPAPPAPPAGMIMMPYYAPHQ